MTMSPHSTLPLFDDSESSGSTPSAADSPARTSASPARVPAWTVSAPDSGESFAVSLASFDPASSSWRMSGLFEGADSLPFSETLPRSGMTRSGTLFLLPPLVHLTSVIASGSSLLMLRTPTSAMIDARSTPPKLHGRKPSDPQVSLADQLLAMERIDTNALLPTPRSADHDSGPWTPRNGQGRNLLAALLPTPTANDYDSQNNGRRGDGSTYRTAGKPSLSTMARRRLIPTPLAQDCEQAGGIKAYLDGVRGLSLTTWARLDRDQPLLPSPQAEDHRNCADYSDGSRKQSPQLRHLGKGRLNPRFVEWMMDYPPGWTDLDGLDS